MRKQSLSKRVKTLKVCIDNILERKETSGNKNLFLFAHQASLLSDSLPVSAQNNLRTILISAKKVASRGTVHLSTVKKINRNWEAFFNVVKS